MTTSLVSNFPGGFVNGLVTRGINVLQAMSGKAFWLYNGTVLERGQVGGSDSNGGTYLRPFATLAGALLQCTAGAGDIIMVKPGHAETISSATALNLNVGDVQIIGLGSGVNRPQFTLDTATTSTINVSANDISLQNIQFVANFANIASLFTLTTAKFFSYDTCEIRDTSAVLNFLNITVTNTTDNAADGHSATNSMIIQKSSAGVCNLFKPLGTADRCRIVNCNYAAVTTDLGAVVPIANGKILTNFVMDNNVISLVQATTQSGGILLSTNGSTNSGWVTRNFVQSLDATTEILATASSGFLFSQNYYSGVADKSGYLLPAADS